MPDSLCTVLDDDVKFKDEKLHDYNPGQECGYICVATEKHCLCLGSVGNKEIGKIFFI